LEGLIDSNEKSRIWTSTWDFAWSSTHKFEIEFFDAIRRWNVSKIRTMIAEDPTIVNSSDERGLSGVIAAMYYGRPDIVELC
jgi:hypothetical protein